MADVVMAGGGPVLECHRYPPQAGYDYDTEVADADAELLAAAAAVEDEVAVLHEVTPHRFPRVRSDDWCGEWQPGDDEEVPPCGSD